VVPLIARGSVVGGLAVGSVLADRVWSDELIPRHDDVELTERGYAAGALAHISKHSAGHELVPAVRAAMRGERYVSPGGRH
jgi:hypothetical protein